MLYIWVINYSKKIDIALIGVVSGAQSLEDHIYIYIFFHIAYPFIIPPISKADRLCYAAHSVVVVGIGTAAHAHEHISQAHTRTLRAEGVWSIPQLMYTVYAHEHMRRIYFRLPHISCVCASCDRVVQTLVLCLCCAYRRKVRSCRPRRIGGLWRVGKKRSCAALK